MRWVKSGGELNPAWNSTEDGSIVLKKGDTLEGLLVDKKTNVGQFDKTVYTVEKKGGDKMDVWGSAVLERGLNPLPIGTLVRLTYLGKEKAKSGGSYHNYEIEYDADSMPEPSQERQMAEEIFGDE